MWCVAVPNVITGGLDLSAADLIVKSLSGLTPEGLAEKLGLTLLAVDENRDPDRRR
jgi:hypothetical protein